MSTDIGGYSTDMNLETGDSGEVGRIVEEMARDIEVHIGYSARYEPFSVEEIRQFVEEDEKYRQEFEELVPKAVSYLRSRDRIEEEFDVDKEDNFGYVRSD